MRTIDQEVIFIDLNVQKNKIKIEPKEHYEKEKLDLEEKD